MVAYIAMQQTYQDIVIDKKMDRLNLKLVLLCLYRIIYGIMAVIMKMIIWIPYTINLKIQPN